MRLPIPPYPLAKVMLCTAKKGGIENCFLYITLLFLYNLANSTFGFVEAPTAC